MPIQTQNTNAQRIGRAKGEMLAHAMQVEVAAKFADPIPMEKNKSDTLVMRRYLPFGATTASINAQNRPVVNPLTHQTAEGITPNADTLVPFDITVTAQQYMVLYSYTDRVYNLNEEDIPKEMVIQTGERMGLLREMIRFGELRSCTNAFYAGGTTIGTTAQIIGPAQLGRVSIVLRANRAKMITKILDSSASYNTTFVEAGYVVLCHTDLEFDIRALPDFREVASYGNRKPLHEMELGSWGLYRFILTPEFAPYADQGATVASTGLFSTTGTNIDVYPIIVMGADAFGEVALRTMKSFTMIDVPLSTKSKSDPGNQRGYIGAKLYAAARIKNAGWMAVLHVGRTNLG
jgi:N4-gp56 family major capsid protein